MALTKVSGSVLKDPLSLGGEVSIGGTLTYQDVTNVDAIGIITARAGVNVSAGQLDVGSNVKIGNSGVATATNFKTGSSNLHSTGLTVGNNFFHSTGINVGTGATIHVPSSNVLTLGTNSGERLRINSNGYVMIGTTTEGAVSGNNLTIGSNTGYCGMTIRSGSSSEGNIFFSDATSGDGESVGMLRYEHNNNAMVIKTANAERLRIKSDGKVVIGTNAAGAKLSVSGNLITDDGTNARITLQADGTSTNQIMSTTTGFGSYCNMSYQAAAHIFKYGGTETFRINADGTFSGKPDQINGRTDNEVLGGKSFKYDTSNISPSWGSGSNGWYSFYHMSDGVYTFWLQTNAHSSICFTASNGYDPSNKSFINVHQFINNPNGNYGNIKGIRITDDGIVQAYIHASASNQYFSMYVQVTCGDLTNMPNLYATITKDTGSPTINDAWGTADAYSPAQGAHTTDGVCSPRVFHNRREMACFATSTGLYGANTSGAK